MDLRTLTGEIVSAAMFVHKTLGPGLLESVYEKCLTYELQDRGFYVETQVPVPLTYRGIALGEGFKADMIINRKVIVELKSLEIVKAVHKKQLLSYLKLADKRVGLLLNFGDVLNRNLLGI